MKQLLKQKIKQTISLTETEIDFVVSLFNEKKLKKRDYFLKEGDVCGEIAFVKHGLLRIFSMIEQQEKTLYFPGKSHFVTSISSFLLSSPSTFSIQAAIETELFVITKDNIELIYATIPGSQRIGFEVFDTISNTFSSRIEQLLTMHPVEVYQLLFTKYPEIIKNVPLKDLASFMNITPQHLSRIRKL